MAPARSVPERIGILGGTFDPIHNGHLALARAAKVELGLAEILLMVAASPPHKDCLTPFAQRLAMAEMACEQEAGLRASSLEGRREGPSFSVDTLRELRGPAGRERKIFFLLGLDAFAELETWKEYEQLPRLAELVVVHRPDSGPSVAAVAKGVYGELGPGEEGGWRLVVGGGRVREMLFPPQAVSSSMIRERVAKGQAIDDLVPPLVAAYIRENSLYLS
ncbi:MAG: nicotinate-nucleotide adenylyltransferase [Thermodesulfobacteriota bacterium]